MAPAVPATTGPSLAAVGAAAAPVLIAVAAAAGAVIVSKVAFTGLAILGERADAYYDEWLTAQSEADQWSHVMAHVVQRKASITTMRKIRARGGPDGPPLPALPPASASLMELREWCRQVDEALEADERRISEQRVAAAMTRLPRPADDSDELFRRLSASTRRRSVLRIP